VVVTGLRPPSPEVARQLRALAPKTDVAGVLFVTDQVKPVPVEKVTRRVQGGAAVVVAGLAVLLVVFRWARRVERAAGV
jgi:hypothetical protein